MSHSLKIGYTMKSQEISYTGTIAGGGYEIIPLYTDSGDSSSVIGCSGLKKLSGSSGQPFTKNFKLDLIIPSASTASV